MAKDERRCGGKIRRKAARDFGVVLLAALVLSGCLTDAADKSYKYNNKNDTTPKGGGGSSDTGTMTIALVDEKNDVVLIANQTAADQVMTDWILSNADATNSYTFADFTLTSGDIVRLHTESGTDDADDLYGAGINWSSTAPDDEADLADGSGNSVDSCTRGDSCWP